MSMNQQGHIELDVRIELRDYLRASYWFTYRRVTFKIVCGFCVLLLLLFVYGRVLARDTRAGDWRLLLLPGAISLGVLGAYFNARRNMASQKALQETIR